MIQLVELLLRQSQKHLYMAPPTSQKDILTAANDCFRSCGQSRRSVHERQHCLRAMTCPIVASMVRSHHCQLTIWALFWCVSTFILAGPWNQSRLQCCPAISHDGASVL